MTDPQTNPAPLQDVETYEVRLRGHLDFRWAAELAAPAMIHEADGTTTLRGIAADQSALHGLLQRLRDLGLTLIAVTRVGSDAAPSILTHDPRTPK